MDEVPEFTFHGDELDFVPDDWPRRIPAKAVVLGEAHWNFSPGSSRSDTYWGWASEKERRVFIWWKDDTLDPELGDPTKLRPYASGPLAGSPREAFRNTLASAWAREVSTMDLEVPHEMRTDFLNRADFSLICSEVWRRPPRESS